MVNFRIINQYIKLYVYFKNIGYNPSTINTIIWKFLSNLYSDRGGTFKIPNTSLNIISKTKNYTHSNRFFSKNNIEKINLKPLMAFKNNISESIIKKMSGIGLLFNDKKMQNFIFFNILDLGLKKNFFLNKNTRINNNTQLLSKTMSMLVEFKKNNIEKYKIGNLHRDKYHQNRLNTSLRFRKVGIGFNSKTSFCIKNFFLEIRYLEKKK